MEKKITIYLADLTHTGQLIATNIHPFAIGLLGAYAKDKLGEKVSIELFRHPEDLRAALEREKPHILGFSNYSWNCNISYEFARRVKAHYPDTVVTFGGPNYGLSEEEQRAFWKQFPLIDFYVVKEGEIAFVELINKLAAFDFNVVALKNASVRGLPNCHYLRGEEFVVGPLLPRIRNLDEIPSPYLTGLMDKFFDNVLIPMTHTTRGCPFTCTFCTEGTKYFNKVADRQNFSRLHDELEYIATRTGTVRDLIITDANFGMYQQDREKALVIADIQSRYNWPQHIHVSGGKNKKERLLEVAAIINGSMNVAASLQTTDAGILANIKRSNISTEQLAEVAKKGMRSDANTYAEIILGLPGDSLRAHTQSLRDAVNAGLSFLRLYQLIMLFDTELNTPETRAQFGMKTKFRVMPRCFGSYEIFGEKFPCAEVEEICISQNSLSYEDYLECRELDLTVEIIHNVYLFRELFGLSKQYNFDWFDLLLRFHNKRRQFGAGLRDLYDEFRRLNEAALWDSKEEARTYAETHLADYIGNAAGVNELFTAKAIAFFLRQDELREALFGEVTLILTERGLLDAVVIQYLDELKEFNRLRKSSLLETEHQFEGQFHFDFKTIMEADFISDPHQHVVTEPLVLHFGHTDEQRSSMEGYIHQYGTSLVGLGRILMRAHVKRLFRHVTSAGEQAIGEAAVENELHLNS